MIKFSRPVGPSVGSGFPDMASRNELYKALSQLLVFTVLTTFSVVGRGQSSPIDADGYLQREDVQVYIDDLVQDHGFARQAIEEVFSQARKQQRIIDLMTRPAERRMRWHEYRKILVDEARVTQGVEFWRENLTTLNRAQAEFGVPVEIIVAIIGVETRYGRITGNHGVVNALATLGFDYPPRAAFFRSELTQFLLLAREEGKNPMSLKGSYAGAMGYGQFIPSSYRNYAIDFNDDGVRDIWNSRVDAIGSVANYFAEHGWRGSAAVTEKVTIANVTEQITELANSSLRPTHTLEQWQQMGVQFGTAPTNPANRKAMLMRMEHADRNEYWLGFDDFYVITRYNHSRLYAMAVYQLSQAIAQRRKSLNATSS